MGIKVWIAPNETDPKVKIFFASHCGNMGHHAWEVTLSVVYEECFWDGMRTDFRKFFKSRLPCMLYRGVEVVPRLLSSVLHG